MILAVIILLVAGIAIKYGKMYFLIAGYNTMSATNKSKYDIQRIASLIGNSFFVMAFMILAGYFVSEWLGDSNLKLISTNIAVITGVVYILISVNSRKLKNNHHK